MKPSSIPLLVVCIFALLLSAIVFIARFFGWLEVNLFVIICAVAAPVVSVYFLIHEYFRKPYIREFRAREWIYEGEEREKIYIHLLAKTHKQGRRPIVEFLDSSLPYSTKLIESIIEDNGDIKFVNPSNHFNPLERKDFKVRILKN